MDAEDQSGSAAARANGPQAGPPALATQARQQQEQLERLLHGGSGHRALDPELVKNLRIVWRLLEAVIGLASRPASAHPDGRGQEPDPGRLARNEDRLRQMITFSLDESIALPVLLGRRFGLEQLLIEVGDRRYLAGRLAEVYGETEGSHVTWCDLYGDELPALLPGPGRSGQPGPAPDATRPMASADEVELTRDRLARLMHAKEADDQFFRARWELKRQAARLVVGSLAAVVAALVGALVWLLPNDAELFACALAGSVGATLGGLIRLRDQVALAAHVRQFRAFFLGQVLVGATAGLVALLVIEADAVRVGRDEGAALAAFVVGFSEAAFVSLISRLGIRSAPDSPPAGPPPPVQR